VSHLANTPVAALTNAMMSLHEACTGIIVVIVDSEVIARLESSAAASAIALAEAFRTTYPGDPARAERRGTGALVALGPGRYVNRAIGVTIDEPRDRELGAIERFFATAGVDSSIELASWCSEELLQRLTARGYANQWFRDVYVRRADDAAPDAPARGGVTCDVVTSTSVQEWQQVLADGLGNADNEARSTSNEFALAVHGVPGNVDVIASIDGELVGCGSLQPAEGVAWLGGAATRPEYRRRGVQSALLAHRIGEVRATGCDLVAATALSGSTSARNLARAGFTLAYVQVVMTQPG
jgi:GNAT superfamily N-acetyltransferase